MIIASPGLEGRDERICSTLAECVAALGAVDDIGAVI
jgi:hypothetical protein